MRVWHKWQIFSYVQEASVLELELVVYLELRLHILFTMMLLKEMMTTACCLFKTAQFRGLLYPGGLLIPFLLCMFVLFSS